MKSFFVLATALTILSLPQAQARGGGGHGGGGHVSAGGGGAHMSAGSAGGMHASAGGHAGSAHAGTGGGEVEHGWGNTLRNGGGSASVGGGGAAHAAGYSGGGGASASQGAASVSHAQVQNYSWAKPTSATMGASSGAGNALASAPMGMHSQVAPAAVASKPKPHALPRYGVGRRGRGYYNPNYYDPNDPTDPNNPNNPQSDAYRRAHHLIPGGDPNTASASGKP